jgi:hypothetical protein
MRRVARLTTTFLVLLGVVGVVGVVAGVAGVAGGVGGVGPSLVGPPSVAGSPSLAGSPSVAGGPSVGSGSLVGPPCAAATAQTLVGVDGNVAERIYRDELAGSGTIADKHQVEEYGPLLSALARSNALAKGGGAGNRAAVKEAVNAVTEAVHQLVYSHTHIVRLRVMQGGKLLADIGGPYIIAPVGGSLRLHGRVVGSYLLSVQDDLGFVGLETRLVGVPLILHVGAVRVPLQGTIRTGSVAIPNRGAVVVGGTHFQAYSFNAKAFPTGLVRISLLLGGRRGSALGCSAVKVAEVGRIARLIWLRFVLDGSSDSSFVTFTQSHTGALTYIRAGARQIAGSTQPGPPLPDSGTVRYRGVTYGVTSFAAQTSGKPAHASMRVYELVRL